METILRLPQIREAIIEELSSILLPLGYKIKNRKGENSFHKKHDDGYFEIQFFYNNFFPIDYTVQFVFRCYQNSVQKIIEPFFQSTQRMFMNVANINLPEGNFIEELRGKLMKYRGGYKNKLATNEDLTRILHNYKVVVNEKILPLENLLYSLDGTADFLYRNRDLLVSNCSDYMMMTSLISMKLIRNKEYENLFEYYLEELPKWEAYGVLAVRALVLIKDLHKFLMDDNQA